MQIFCSNHGKRKGQEKFLGKSSQIPSILQDHWVYFHQENPKSKGVPIYKNIWVLMDLSHDQMVAENRLWLMQGKMSL